MICSVHATCGYHPSDEEVTDFLGRSIRQGDTVGIEIVYVFGGGTMIGMATESECIAITGVPASFKRFLRSCAVLKATFGPELELDFPVETRRWCDLQAEVANTDKAHPSKWRLPSLEEVEMIYLGTGQPASHAACVVCTACRIRDLEVVIHRQGSANTIIA